MRLRSRLLTALPFVVAVALVAVTSLLPAEQDAAAHAGHAQKKLFGGRWYKPSVDLTTSPTWFGVPGEPSLYCDGGVDVFSCISKWQAPAFSSLVDWNNQPDTARFVVQGNRDLFHDINIYAVDQIIQPGVLGLAVHYDSSVNQCNPDACTYRYGDAFVADDGHAGSYGTFQVKQATVTHELGHLLSLRHESTNESGQPPFPLYECGQDNTGPIPVSIMAYDCINPPPSGSGIYTVQPWDVCGVNHAYPDAAYGTEGCVCFPPASGGPAPPSSPTYFHPLPPARILDTRSSPQGSPAGKVGHGCVISVQVAGVGGVPAGVSAVVVNATVAQPTQPSFLTLYPSGTSLPLAANLNFLPGQTVPNLVTVRVGADGKINIYNAQGTTHVILDVAGWYDTTPGATLRQAGGTPDGTVASHGGPNVVGIDTDTTGNTATTLGTIDPCIQTTAGSTVTVDAFVTNIPPYSDGGTPGDPNDDSGGIIGWQFVLQYDETPLTMSTENQNFLLYSNAGSGSPFSVSEPLPDTDNSDSWLSSSLDIGTGVPESGSGVLARLEIVVDAAAPNGQYNLIMDVTNVAILDVQGEAFVPHSLGHAAIAVGQSCGPIVTPSPPPSPSPTPSPTPTPSPSPTPTATATPSGFGYYHPVTPTRFLDTRTSPQGSPAGKVDQGETIIVDVTNPAGVPGGSVVPSTGVSAVVLNVTVTEPTTASFLTVFPADVASPPLAANLNFLPGQTIPNLVIVKVGQTGAPNQIGSVKVFNQLGSVHVIFDVAGWFGGPESNGKLFTSMTPTRILDTRSSPQGIPPGPVDQNESIRADVTVGSVPAGASAVIVNTTVTQPTQGSYLTVYPSEVASPPLAANLNFVPGQTVPNLVIVKVGTNPVGEVKVYNKLGSVHVIFDIAGWYGP
jgi:hypothetical protein